MAQLKMYWLAGTPIEEYTLPEGYTVSRYNGTAEDRKAWVDCCKNGLVGDEPFEEIFADRILDHDFTNPDTDTYFIDFGGEHVGTITAVHHTDVNCGEVHMVGLKTEFRGKGLGKHLNSIALKDLEARGVDYIYLTTDEWRKGAVKSYLSSGFKPVEYDEGMTERWQAVMAEYGIDSLDMVDEDANFVKTIYR